MERLGLQNSKLWSVTTLLDERKLQEEVCVGPALPSPHVLAQMHLPHCYQSAIIYSQGGWDKVCVLSGRVWQGPSALKGGGTRSMCSQGGWGKVCVLSSAFSRRVEQGLSAIKGGGARSMCSQGGWGKVRVLSREVGQGPIALQGGGARSECSPGGMEQGLSARVGQSLCAHGMISIP